MPTLVKMQPVIVPRKPEYWIVPLVFVISVMVFYYLAYPLMNDNDVPWHLAIGALLTDTLTLPKTDPWAYGNQEQPWFILSWVWNIILGVTEKLSGQFGVFMLTLMVGGGLVAGLCAHMMRLGIALPPVLMTTILAGVCLLDYITARPQLAGYMLAFAFYVILHGSRGDGRYGKLLWLPALMLVWANAHGSFMVGFIIIAAYLVEAWFTHNMVWFKRLLAIAAACLFCATINPYGPEVAIGAMVSFKGSATKYTMEWMPFSFTFSTGLSTWLIVIILASNLRGAKISIADKVLAMGWLLATMFSMRNGAFFILTSAAYVATCLDEQTRDLREVRPSPPFVTFMQKQKLAKVWVVSIFMLMLFSVSASMAPHADKIESEDFSIKDAIDYAQEHHPKHHFLTDYSLGGQVIYHTQGKLPFFMDSRAVTAYSDDAMKDFLEFLRLSKGWESIMTKYKLNGIIVPNSSGFATSYDQGLFHDHWKLVFAGKRASVYIARP